MLLLVVVVVFLVFGHCEGGRRRHSECDAQHDGLNALLSHASLQAGDTGAAQPGGRPKAPTPLTLHPITDKEARKVRGLCPAFAMHCQV